MKALYAMALSTLLAACGGGGDGPTFEQVNQCGPNWCESNATNAQHVAAGRAFAVAGVAYAAGSGDVLGPADEQHTYCICQRADAWRAGSC